MSAFGEMSFDMSVFHVALGGASVLVDLGFGDAPERYMKRVPYWWPSSVSARWR